MKAKLRSPDTSPPDSEFELDRFPTIIGRSPDAEIQALDGSVSEWHCELKEANGRLIVRDLGSTYGTFVNGRRIDVAPLLPGDKLTVGTADFIASYELPEAMAHSQMLEDGDFPILEWNNRADVTFVHLVNLLERQRLVFRRLGNGNLWQAEQMFPDPPHPEYLEHLLVEEMKHVGVAPQFIYAFERTGIIVSEFNYDTVSEQQLVEWRAAVEEYEECYGGWSVEQRYPVGAITMYGPDRTTTTMIVAAVVADPVGEPIYRRWIGSDVAADWQVKMEITEFFGTHGVRSVIHVKENVGCPHREGLDYPLGDDCPFCPYWKGRRRDSN